jgi:hypothetical protein
LFFLIYINDLPNKKADPSKPILFADDTSIIITNPSPSKCKEDINNTCIIHNINNWFRAKSLSINFDETYFLKFRPKISYEINIKVSCDNKNSIMTHIANLAVFQKGVWYSGTKVYNHLPPNLKQL